MKMLHIFIEGYCDGTKGKVNDCCKNALKPGIHCLECPHFSYTKCPNEIAVSNNDGLIECSEDFIGFGGEMEPEDLQKRDDYISIWKDICRKKINEAYDEYMSLIS